ncbi:MAG: neutral/alkaline non-lysosomal ceramidase N-terminal domain-containing protein [Planctomycetota bacterium]|nr:neutral/alkaline non-lysosomal ceramidase N-terminal domain-containing protein [Planctomycetota bacterium]
MLHCGAAKASINPELPIHLLGYRGDLVATGIHDDLHVAALYLERGGERVALLTYDTISLDAAFVDDVQRRCSEATGLPPRAILTTVSHSHSTPGVRFNVKRAAESQPLFSAAYRERVLARSAEALAAAVKSAEPAAVSYNSGRIRENLNRRVFFPSGQYFYQPKQKNLSGLSDGAVDDELGVLFFKRLKGEGYVATLVNYTAHPLTVGDTSTLASADYPGVLKREIEASLGGVALFVQGACGDNHPLGAEAGFSRSEQMGLALAQKALYHRWDSVALDDPPLGCEYRELVLPEMSETEFRALPQNFSFTWRPPREDLRVNGGLRAHVSLWALGPILFVGVPGEVTAEWGLRLKWSSPFAKTFVMFLATDHIGYIPHRNAYEWGGYEVLTSPLGAEAGEVLAAEALKAANELKRKMSAGGRKLHLPGAETGSAPANQPGAVK